MGIAVLGPLSVNGDPGVLSRRDRVVLAALAVGHGQVVSPEQLADALWGEHLPTSWRKVVQGCVMRLRKVLGTRSILTSPQGYRLALPADDIDARRFERLVGQARELLTLGQSERAAYLLGECLALWRGRPLAELDDWDSGTIEAQRLSELRLDAEELRVEAALRTGRHRQVLAEAHSLVAASPVRERRWALLALAEYQAGRQAEALRTLHQARTLLASELGLDPGPDLVALEQGILRQDATLVAEAALPEPSAACPYQGLLPYDVADGESFFGRDADIAEALRRLDASGVLVVVGPSGSGKSSLVRAGVGAALEREGRPVVVITPGTHPLDALTAVSSSHWPALVVDQCEEAIALCSDSAEQAAFFQRLADYADQGRLVVALRADRIGALSAHAPFARLVERGLFLLTAMGPDQLRACIEGPAQQAGLLLEPGLVDLLVREVEGEPGALPLLSHALRETWLQREGRTLTVAGYQSAGGIRGAVARSAEAVYARVAPEHQPIVRDLMLRLVAPSIEGEPVRGRMPRRMVTDDVPHQKIVELLVGARLVITDDGVLELAHEALARAWPRLRQWLEDDTQGRRILRHLSAAADAWDTMGRPDSELYRGVRLAQALDWQDQSAPELTPIEGSFLQASHDHVDIEIRAAQQQARHDARARRRTRRLAGGLAVALVLTVAATAMATGYQRQAENRALESDANGLAALSKSVASLDLSLLLAAEALRSADTAATQDGMLTSLIQHRRATRVLQLGQTPFDAELGDRGTALFVATQSEVLRWDVAEDAPPRSVVQWDQPQDIAASPTDDLVALWSWRDDETPQVGVFDGSGDRRLSIVGFEEIGGFPQGFGFSPDGRRLLMGVMRDTRAGGRQSSVHEYDVATGERIRVTPTLSAPNQKHWMWTAFAADGRSAVSSILGGTWAATALNLPRHVTTPLKLRDPPAEDQGYVPLRTGSALASIDGTITLFDHNGVPTQRLQVHREQVSDIVVSPEGTWAVSADAAGSVIVWNVDPATGLWSQRESLVGHTGGVTGVALDPTSQTVVTVSFDGTAIAWDLSPAAGFGSPIAGLQDRWISNRPQTIIPGELVVAPTRPAPNQRRTFHQQVSVAAAFLDARTGEVVDKVPIGHTVSGSTFGSSVAVSPDRTKVAVTYAEGTAVLDTRTREEVARITLPAVEEFGDSHPEWVWCAAWTPDGSRLLLGAEGTQLDRHDGNLVVVDTATWKVNRSRVDIAGAAQTMESSPDGQMLAVGMTIPPVNDAPPGTVKLLDADTLKVRRELHMRDEDYPFDLSYSPDGSLLAVGTATGEVFVFDVASGRPLHEPTKLHDEFVQQVEWLPDGQTVVSTGADGFVALYDVERGLPRVTMPGSAALNKEYTYLLSVSERKIVAVTGATEGRIYPLTVGQWLQHACHVAGRDLTRDEWASYLPGRDYRHTCGDRT